MRARERRSSVLSHGGAGNGETGGDAIRRALLDLKAAWGIQFRAAETVLRALVGDEPVSQEAVIRDSGLSHRSVVEITRKLEPWLEGDPHGWRLAAGARRVVRAELVHQGLRASPDDAAVLDEITRLVSRAPARRRELDHVVATPETCLRRARFLARTYALEGGHVVFLGDHDLTSLALALLVPEARVSVVDVDDDLLAYVDRSSRDLGRRVTCHFADLRLGVPQALRASADLVFTDPPYTPEGIQLFAARGCEALRQNDLSRLLLCYGHGERQPMLGFKAQSALHALRLVSEAIHPRFNQYLGAQAIGSTSALYVLRPVGLTWKALERATSADARIYSHGGMSIEAHPRKLPDEIQSGVMARLGDAPEPPVFAGSGWTAGPAADVLSLPALWRLYERHASALPARRPRMPDTVAVNLLESPPLTARVLLVNRSRRLLLVVPSRHARMLVEAGGRLVPLLGAVYTLTEVARHDGIAVVEALRRSDDDDDAGRIARYLVQHPTAGLANALREAVVHAAEAVGRPMTKNEARGLVDEHGLADSRDLRLHDLPLHVLEEVASLVPVLAASIERLS